MGLAAGALVGVGDQGGADRRARERAGGHVAGDAEREEQHLVLGEGHPAKLELLVHEPRDGARDQHERIDVADAVGPEHQQRGIVAAQP